MAPLTALLLFRDPDVPGVEALFPALLNDLCVCGYSITSAQLRHGRIELALDGHGFALCRAGGADVEAAVDGQARGGSAQPCRPDLPGAGLRAAALGLVFVRPGAQCRLQVAPGTPDAVAAALLHALFRLTCPDAVLLEREGLIFTAREALALPLAQLASAAGGAPLPCPMPRYARPEALGGPRRKSVFAPPAKPKAARPACNERTGDPPARAAHGGLFRQSRGGSGPTVGASHDPVQLPERSGRSQHPAMPPDRKLRCDTLRIGSTGGAVATTAGGAMAGGAMAGGAMAGQDVPQVSDFIIARALRGAEDDAAAPLHPAVTSGARTLRVTSALCDGLALAARNGEHRVVATLPFTTALLIGLTALSAGDTGHVLPFAGLIA